MRPIRCIECYRKRPGGRCEYCPLHKRNRPRYRHLGDGWYQLVPQEDTLKKQKAPDGTNKGVN